MRHYYNINTDGFGGFYPVKNTGIKWMNLSSLNNLTQINTFLFISRYSKLKFPVSFYFQTTSELRNQRSSSVKSFVLKWWVNSLQNEFNQHVKITLYVKIISISTDFPACIVSESKLSQHPSCFIGWRKHNMETWCVSLIHSQISLSASLFISVTEQLLIQPFNNIQNSKERSWDEGKD